MSENVNVGRRQAVLGGASALLLMMLSNVAAQVAAPPERAHLGLGDPIFMAALDFLKRSYVQHERPVVYGPVSRLQREFLLGYRDGCALAAALAAEQVWHLSGDSQGRFATIALDSPHLRLG
jgi:hypothetical protein